MNNTGTTVQFESYNINKYDMEISNSLFDCRIYWARVISSENESLFTQYTKHTFYEIQYALEGHIGMLLGENQRVDVAESDFIVIPPDTYHQIVEGDTGSRFIMAFSVSIKDESLLDNVKYLDVPIPYHETPHMRRLLSLILEKCYLDHPLRKQMITSLVESFLFEIFEGICPMSDNEEQTDFRMISENERRVEQIMAFIHSYNGIGIQVSDVAKQFNMSERHLNRVFQSVMQTSLKDAINHEKLKKIEELIMTTDLSFNEISALCGFFDGYAMNKFFCKYNFINLSEFRKLAKKEKKSE